MKLTIFTMKTFVFCFLLGFVWQWSGANGICIKGISDKHMLNNEHIISVCLIDNGFTNSTSDVERIYAIGDPKQADKLKNVPKEKMANLTACVYGKLYLYKNLYPRLRQLIDRDDTVTVGQKRQMEDIAKACKRNAGGKIRNAEFLNCVNITEPPFDHLFAVMRDVRQALQWCFVGCNVLISEMYTMERNRHKPLKEYINYIPNDTLGCFMACKAEQDAINNPDRTLQKGLADLIKSSKNVDENDKKEMLESLNKCSIEVYGFEDEPYELVKCLDLFKPPFIDIFEKEIN